MKNKEIIEKVLDLYCGAGGSSMGINQVTNAEITGIDIIEQPDYPFKFIKADATKLSAEFLKQFDFIWASPPCQEYIYASKKARNKGKKYPDLIKKTRELLESSGKPYVIENVTTAPIKKDLILRGEMFGLKIIRKRAFEIKGFSVIAPLFKKYPGKVSEGFYITCAGHGGNGKASLNDFQNAMQIFWTKNKKAICEAVTPSYSRYIFFSFLLQKALTLADENHEKEIEELEKKIKFWRDDSFDMNNELQKNNQKLQNIKDELKTKITKKLHWKFHGYIVPEMTLYIDEIINQIFSNHSQQDKTSSDDGYTDNVSVPRGDKPADKPSDAGSPLRSAITGGDDLICECGHRRTEHQQYEEDGICFFFANCECRKFTPKKKKEKLR